jgi:ABC-2 type transport system ATP-binding protein
VDARDEAMTAGPGPAKVRVMTDVVLTGLTKRFGGTAVVDDLSCTIGPGVTGFLGPNGAGKTTTLRMLLGLVRPTAGTATIGGQAYAELAEPRRTVGALLEATGFHPGRTARDHLAVLGSNRVDAVLDEVGLSADADRRVGRYSLGMRQRLGLAAALLGDPEVLILDEPGNGLDPAGMAWLRTLLKDLAARGRTVIVSSHLLAEVVRTADRVVILDAGVLRFAGTVDDQDLESAFLRLTAR